MARSDGIDECGALRAAKVFEGGRSAYDERLISYRGLHDLLICATLELAGAGGDGDSTRKLRATLQLVAICLSVCLPATRVPRVARLAGGGARGVASCGWHAVISDCG